MKAKLKPLKKGKRFMLPSSFVGGRRFMDQLYFDGMTIYGHVGFPDLFVTFTYNPKRPKISRILKSSKLSPSNRPDIIARVFRIKFDELLSDLTKKHTLGIVIACKY